MQFNISVGLGQHIQNHDWFTRNSNHNVYYMIALYCCIMMVHDGFLLFSSVLREH